MLHDQPSRFGDNEGEGWTFVTSEQLNQIIDGDCVAATAPADRDPEHRSAGTANTMALKTD